MEEGQDSFLDVISNMVGILIILVMIAGVRAANSDPEPVEPLPAITQAQEREKPALADEKLMERLEASYKDYTEQQRRMGELRGGLEDMKESVARIQEKIAAQSGEKAAVLESLSTLKAAVEIHEEKLDDATKEALRLQAANTAADAKLDQMRQQVAWFQTHRPDATKIENQPTPIARDIEGKEALFRFANGRIAHVPYTQLTEKMRADVSLRKNDLFKQSVTSNTVGPIDGFRMQYTLRLYDVLAPGGDGVGKRLELEYAEFQPLDTLIGEPIEEALREGSTFLSYLDRYRPDIYAVTIWIYPDSFSQYQELRKYLYQRGYKVAARPLEPGQPISASPHGTRSSAQ